MDGILDGRHNRTLRCARRRPRGRTAAACSQRLDDVRAGKRRGVTRVLELPLEGQRAASVKQEAEHRQDRDKDEREEDEDLASLSVRRG